MTALPPDRYVLTFHKCGSQWVRDVLWDADVLTELGLRAGAQGIDASAWPAPSGGRLHAPVYSVDAATWAQRRPRGGRAAVVVRDPRDMMVSWIASVTHSHAPPEPPSRTAMREFTPREQLLAALAWIGPIVGKMASWLVHQPGPDVYVTSYERLIVDQAAEFQAIAELFGGVRSSEAVRAAVERQSFSARSGRAPGTEDVYSHFRLGSAGDWRRWFDRSAGQLFEALHPGVLTDLGYESTNLWFEGLAPHVDAALPPTDHAVADLLVELRRVQEENHLLRRVCDERLDLITNLSTRLEKAVHEAPPIGAPDILDEKATANAE